MSQTPLEAPLPYPRHTSSWLHYFLKAFIQILPSQTRFLLYTWVHRIFGKDVTPCVARLPFRLALKRGKRDSIATESQALQLLEKVPKIYSPILVDYVSYEDEECLLMEWIDGVLVSEVWDDLSTDDKSRLTLDLREQLSAFRKAIKSSNHEISDSLGRPINDPRVPWIMRENPRTFSSTSEFAGEVWPGFKNKPWGTILEPVIQPIFSRNDFPIVFCHGDLIPQNLIIPNSLEAWRAGHGRVHIIDWEYSGWLPSYWDAIKSVWLVFEVDSGWYQMMENVFSEDKEVMRAEMAYRTHCRITIL